MVERAVSFTKGCYIGQEPIVRLPTAATPIGAAPAAAGAPAELPATLPATTSREVGRPTSTATLPEGGAAALGYVRSAVADGASLVAFDARGSALRLWTLVEWPQGARSSGDRAQPCGG